MNIVQCSVVGFTPRVLKGVTVKWRGPTLQNAVEFMFLWNGARLSGKSIDKLFGFRKSHTPIIHYVRAV